MGIPTDHVAVSPGALAVTLEHQGLEARLATARASIDGRIVFTTSFGLEDQTIAHAIFSQHLDIDVLTLDTGRLFEETYAVWRDTEEKYGIRIPALTPDRSALESWIVVHGINGFRESVDARHGCCHVRKVEPLRRALMGAAGWITGLRAGQSRDRSQTPLAISDPDRGVLKINPLADWRREDVAAYVTQHSVPYNALHDRGFPSVGCAPCTRAVNVGEPERAGRWWWEQEAKKECGLHLGGATQSETRQHEAARNHLA
jgi:phosphoadenosine phosphosulfate reductase